MRKFGLFMLGLTAILCAGTLAQAQDDEDTDNKFSIHGEVRFRGESWTNLTDFADTDGDIDHDTFDIYPYRVRLAAKGDLGNDIWVYGEFQASGVAGGGFFGEVDPFFGDETELFNSGVSLYQGYVKVKDVGKSVLDLTFGRTEIVFDRGLHFSSLDFYNGISHDGVMASWDWENMGLHAFWFRPFESNVFFGSGGVLDPGSNADDDTLGVHWNMMIGQDKEQDVAAYVFHQTQNTFGLTSDQDKTEIFTVGGRWGRSVKGETGFLWNIEAALQFGDVQPCINFGGPCGDTLDQKAHVIEGAFGYNWHGGKTDQKIWGGALLASGDEDGADEDSEAFMPLYTDFHERLGYADLFAPMNIQAINVGYKINVDDRHIAGAKFFNFTSAEETDFNMSPLTGVVVSDPTPCITLDECEDDLGNELDLFYTYAMTNNFSFDTALAWFMPGDAVEQTFGHDDAAWRIYGQARARW
ncbi:MAG TPA: alginate export family protein [Candidatus Polarisedimenticolia bacterium]|nr:alginate export family protein [Candidatus Polarisedimenticolia bacterium]